MLAHIFLVATLVKTPHLYLWLLQFRFNVVRAVFGLRVRYLIQGWCVLWRFSAFFESSDKNSELSLKRERM